MARTWVLDTDTKGTGARMVPLEDVLEKPAPRPKRTPSPRPSTGKRPAAPGRPQPKGEKRSTPLPPGHVRKKSTGEIGRVKAVDAKAGTVTVFWLKGGATSTVPISSISRR